MKKTILLLSCLLCCLAAKAQSDILTELSPAVKVTQGDAVREAFEEHMQLNERSTVNGFRIRIYTGNGKNSDLESAKALATFKATYPDIPVERSYSHSSYKVTAGYFRTKTDAAREIKRIRQTFPGCFPVGETFRYPTLPSERKALMEAALTPVAPGTEEGEQ